MEVTLERLYITYEAPIVTLVPNGHTIRCEIVMRTIIWEVLLGLIDFCFTLYTICVDGPESKLERHILL